MALTPKLEELITPLTPLTSSQVVYLRKLNYLTYSYYYGKDILIPLLQEGGVPLVGGVVGNNTKKMYETNLLPKVGNALLCFLDYNECSLL